MKNILIINYSQTGQLNDILDNLTIPLQHHNLEVVRVTLKAPYPFPWTGKEFFDAMPETVAEEPMELNPLEFRRSSYDLIIVGYQPWFLSPSRPASSLLKHPDFKKIANNTPVITVIGSRNMWLNSQESVKALLREAGAKLVGNIPLVDRNNNLLSALTIMHWMFRGKKTKMWGVLPKPGVLEEDINSCNEFGEIIDRALEGDDLGNLQDQLLSLGRINVRTNILFIEERAKKIFLVWVNIIKKKGTTPAKRSFWVGFFKYYLVFALFIVSPILLLIFNVLIRPFINASLERKKRYFCSVKLKTEDA